MKWLALALIFLSCYSNMRLVDRGLSPEERRQYIIQFGYSVNQEVRKNFMDGYVCRGMPKELVFQLYGPPDVERSKGNVWEYLGRKAEIIAKIEFEKGFLIEALIDTTSHKY